MAAEFAVPCAVLLADLEEVHLHLGPTPAYTDPLWQEPPSNTPEIELERPSLDELVLLHGHPRLRLVSVQGPREQMQAVKSRLAQIGFSLLRV